MNTPLGVATQSAKPPRLEMESVPSLKLSQDIQDRLICPVCKGKLSIGAEHISCRGCGATYPVIDGVPILIDDESSVFSVDDFVSRRSTTFDLRQSWLQKVLLRILPSVSKNIKGKENYEKFARVLLDKQPAAQVLIVGGSIAGQGMDGFLSNPCIELVETDVSFGPRTVLICDAHRIPFEDETFDGAIAQAVLEHVVDPYKCAEEIHRVLKPHGLVYAETPFIQQVHAGRYDFTRFTHLGHRRLFRRFDEIDSGVMCGPGMALAWSYQYFLLSFAGSTAIRAMIRAFAGFTSFYLKYIDYYLVDRPGALDAASGYYFIGRKGTNILSDKELVKLYRGALR